jgi:hypothetical protein
MARLRHIDAAQRRALTRLAAVLPADAYLAGGVAVAALVDHRVSRDLDVFMSPSDPETLVHVLSQLEGMRLVSRAKGTLHVELSGVPISLLWYPYEHLSPPRRRGELAVAVASAEDLTAMKLSAIAGRGAAKDFWDLHELLAFRGIELAQAIAELERKLRAQDPGSVVRSLAYFGDADAEPLPLGLQAGHWARIKADFRRWTAEL